jgi:hypothetical protein
MRSDRSVAPAAEEIYRGGAKSPEGYKNVAETFSGNTTACEKVGGDRVSRSALEYQKRSLLAK